jgi:disulfide bond formation protein DsbB
MIMKMFNILKCLKAMPLLMAVISTSALGMALVSQYGFNLHPCELCIWQRWPYGIVILLGILGFIISFKNQKAVAGIMGFIGLIFLVNSAIAFYHTGVEQKWWKSFLEGCSVPELKGDMQQILADIQSRSNAARCDEIPWSDPIFNLSMANYNVIFCLGLAIIAFASAKLILKS